MVSSVDLEGKLLILNYKLKHNSFYKNKKAPRIPQGFK